MYRSIRPEYISWCSWWLSVMLSLQEQTSKKKLVPRPPSVGRPGSRSKLRRLSSHPGKHASTVSALNRNTLVPPVTSVSLSQESASPASSSTAVPTARASNSELSPSLPVPVQIKPTSRLVFDTKLGHSSSTGVQTKPVLESVKETANSADLASKSPLTSDDDVAHENDSQRKEDRKDKGENSASPESGRSGSSHRDKLKSISPCPIPAASTDSPGPLVTSVAAYPPTVPGPPNKGLERLLSSGSQYESSTRPPSHGMLRSAPRKESLLSSLETLRESLTYPSVPGARYPSTADRKPAGGVVLESLGPSEVRAMSGMLNDLVRSASRTRTGYKLSRDVGKIGTPDGRLMVRSITGTFRFSVTWCGGTYMCKQRMQVA